MRGAIEFADWVLLKLKIRRYLRIRDKNVLINTPHRWLLRIGALFVLLLPVIILVHNTGFQTKVSPMTPPPLADLPGYEGKAFAKAAWFNLDISPTWHDFFIAFGFDVFIQFTMSIVLNLRYGQRGGSGNSDSVISGSLASPTPPGGGDTKERGNETDETESRSSLSGAGRLGRGQRRQDARRVG